MARDFNGSTQDLLVQSTPVTAPPFTLSALFYMDVSLNNDVLLSISDYSSNPEDILGRIQIRGANDNFIAYTSAAGASSFSEYTGASVSTATWYHGAGVFTSASSRTAYLDGNAATPETTTRSPTGIDCVSIATSYNASTGQNAVRHQGLIAECAIWNVALTAAEIAILAKGYSPLLVRPASLVAYWPLASRQSPELDIVGGYDMTLNNAPTVAAHPNIYYPGVLPFSMEGTPELPVYYPRPPVVSPDVGGIMTV